MRRDIYRVSTSTSLLICRGSGNSIAAVMDKLQAGEICGLWEALSLSMSKAELQNTGYLVAAALSKSW